MSSEGHFSVKLGIRNKFLVLNLVILGTVLVASGLTISTIVTNSESQDYIITIQIILISIVVGILGLTFFYRKSITKSLVEAANIIKKISEGDLSVEVQKSNTNDEIGKLTNSLYAMVTNLRQLS